MFCHHVRILHPDARLTWNMNAAKFLTLERFLSQGNDTYFLAKSPKGKLVRSSYNRSRLKLGRDSELTRAELAYRNGEYTQALTIALNTIKKVHPETVEQLINGGKKDNA